MRLRRRIATLLLASATLSTSAIALSTPTGLGAIEGVIDIAVAIDAQPDVVSPPGELALYAVEASNKGLVSVAEANITIALPAGSSYNDDLSTAACSGGGATATCPVSDLVPGAPSQKFDIVASTPTTAAEDLEAEATIEDEGLEEPLEFRSNNTSTTEIDVRAASGNGAYGLVEGGDSLTLVVGDGRVYELTVPSSSEGVIVSIEPADGGGRMCGTSLCDKGFLTRFVEDHPVFHARNSSDPIKTSRTFGPYGPCKGVGEPTNQSCGDLYYNNDPETSLVMFKMQPCTATGTADPAPCKDGSAYKRHPAGSLWMNVNLLSTDPLEMPPYNLGN